MWLFTRYGFFSATRGKPGTQGASLIQVRARRREHLTALFTAFPVTGTAIAESPDNDYRWRAWLTPEQWADVAARLAMDTTYDNFKDSVDSGSRIRDPEYAAMLHTIWSQHAGIQTDGAGRRASPWEGKSRTPRGAATTRGLRAGPRLVGLARDAASGARDRGRARLLRMVRSGDPTLVGTPVRGQEPGTRLPIDGTVVGAPRIRLGQEAEDVELTVSVHGRREPTSVPAGRLYAAE
jgi:hypothetical protein